MKIDVACSACKKKYRLDASHAEKLIRCKNCQAAIQVPNSPVDTFNVNEFDDLPLPPKASKKQAKRKKKRLGLWASMSSSFEYAGVPIGIWLGVGLIGLVATLALGMSGYALMTERWWDAFFFAWGSGTAGWGAVKLFNGNRKSWNGAVMLSAVGWAIPLMIVIMGDSEKVIMSRVLIIGSVGFACFIIFVTLLLPSSMRYCNKE
ncbi:MAG: hypothetical protein R3C18_25040 [Planctomycetaceae bacterium]